MWRKPRASVRFTLAFIGRRDSRTEPSGFGRNPKTLNDQPAAWLLDAVTFVNLDDTRRGKIHGGQNKNLIRPLCPLVIHSCMKHDDEWTEEGSIETPSWLKHQYLCSLLPPPSLTLSLSASKTRLRNGFLVSGNYLEISTNGISWDVCGRRRGLLDTTSEPHI